MDFTDSLADQAEAWIILLNSGHVTDTDLKRLQVWRAQSPAHDAALREAEALWRDMGLAVKIPAPRPRRSQRNSRLALAAAVLLAVGAARLLGWVDIWRSDYHTATGEHAEIDLTDGSRVTLDTATALAVAFDDHTRRITLLRGRAAFQVAPDAARPFEVTGGAVTARALGTAFDVALNGDDIAVTVSEHTVAVRAAEQTVTVNSGQTSHWDGHSLSAPAPVDLRAATAWRKGKLLFNDRPLAAAIAELDRYQPGAILITGSELPALRVTGVFPLDPPAAVLTDIATTLKLRLTRLGPWLTVLHR